MNIQPFLPSTCGLLVALSCLIAQTGFAQSSLQISNGKMIMQTRSASIELNRGGQSLYALPTELRSAPIVHTSGGWQMKPHSISSSMQRTAITLSAAALKQPCQLTISAPGADLTGHVKVDGKAIRLLKGSTSFNLAPYLSSGVRTIEISGKSSSNTPIQVKFVATGTRILQQTRSQGTLKNLLVITVR